MTLCAALILGPSRAQGEPATAPTAQTRSAPAQQKQKKETPTAAPDQQKTRPAPPRRPATVQQQPAGATPPAAPAPAQKAPPPAALAPHAPMRVDTSQPPPSLPRASRGKMRACAEEWDRMKRESAGGLPMWRDFAADCLTR